MTCTVRKPPAAGSQPVSSSSVSTCPKDITLTAATVDGSVEYVIPGVNKTVKLPVGLHHYFVNINAANCSFTVTVKGILELIRKSLSIV